jgi:hypothetical protein
MLETDDFVKGTIAIPIIPVPELQSSKNKEASGPGFFSTFAQLFSGGADPEYYEPHPEDVEAESVAFECIRFCHVEDIFMDSK